MKSTQIAFFSAAALALLTSASPAREFEDQFGRTIEADLVSHTGVTSDTVTLKMGGKQMAVKVAQFSQKDQAFIRDWMGKTAPTIDYNFRITPKLVKVPAEGDAMPGEKFELQITNLSRAAVSGLSVEYRLYMKDYPSSASDVQNLLEKAGGLAGLGGGRRGGKIEPDLEHIESKVKVESVIEFNKSATVETKPVTIHSGKNPLNGDRYSDEVVGIIARVLDPAGKVVFEHRDKKTADFVWAIEDPSTEFGISLD
jgi:hypothetical protein